MFEKERAGLIAGTLFSYGPQVFDAKNV